jgi:hypothetical protein
MSEPGEGEAAGGDGRPFVRDIRGSKYLLLCCNVLRLPELAENSAQPVLVSVPQALAARVH